MSTTSILAEAIWVKSSYSNADGGGCVEWAPALAPTGVIPIRDSKRPERTPLTFEPAGWATFVEALKSSSAAWS
ncbi:DUF397 domain-containing protein [Streptomyces griseocarneus]|uniref:DUF397 domain-containing protein n=1 Tax=Streptomyces griseocarneus TaxID=51201 RepID=UPI00167ED10C|nr:DUF397 domain-containing protein [Streptomyces griseocarneus]MBZ6476788.1 DUF397 domain-containing protein [Streptomyces griseocarneus]GHG81448.1 hypothetical protein GCM10018779_63640 [Streptomyces griseocarneus]